MVAGRISAERFDRLSSNYEEEQKQFKTTISQLAELIEFGEEKQHDLNRFLQNVRRYTDNTGAPGEILNDLVDRIIVHAPDKSSGHRRQKIGIFYKAVGIIDIPDVECIAEHGALGVPKPRKHTV